MWRQINLEVVLLFLGQVTPRGVARDADLQGITYSTLFQYLESHEDPTSLSEWITPLVLFLIIQRGDLGTLIRFQSSEEDTPLSAAVKFCVLTGKVMLSFSYCHDIMFWPIPPRNKMLLKYISCFAHVGWFLILCCDLRETPQGCINYGIDVLQLSGFLFLWNHFHSWGLEKRKWCFIWIFSMHAMQVHYLMACN